MRRERRLSQQFTQAHPIRPSLPPKVTCGVIRLYAVAAGFAKVSSSATVMMGEEREEEKERERERREEGEIFLCGGSRRRGIRSVKESLTFHDADA